MAVMSDRVEDRVARPGGISYLEVPCSDGDRAGEFYRGVFGWQADGTRFADGTGHVIGHFVQHRAPTEEAGIRPYVFVTDVDDALARATSHGGTAVEPPYPEGNLRVATFRDPFGNVIGVWQEAESS
jgi:predicted enzyme related to lactoylglutathione lyase